MSGTAPVHKPRAKTGRFRNAAAAVGVTAALLGAGVVSAQAAGYVAPGQSTYVSTNGWGPSTICVYNQGSQWGEVHPLRRVGCAGASVRPALPVALRPPAASRFSGSACGLRPAPPAGSRSGPG